MSWDLFTPYPCSLCSLTSSLSAGSVLQSQALGNGCALCLFCSFPGSRSHHLQILLKCPLLHEAFSVLKPQAPPSSSIPGFPLFCSFFFFLMLSLSSNTLQSYHLFLLIFCSPPPSAHARRMQALPGRDFFLSYSLCVSPVPGTCLIHSKCSVNICWISGWMKKKETVPDRPPGTFLFSQLLNKGSSCSRLKVSY